MVKGSKHGYRYFRHTADVEFRAYGDTLEEAFSNAALALFNTIADIRRVKRQGTGDIRATVLASSNSVEDLLWRTLQNALSIGDADGLFFYAVDSLEIKTMADGSYRLRARLVGKTAAADTGRLDVKGVSKYDMHISKFQGGLAASAVLDV
ncbi:MAG: archease [Candidatus Marsarchaeota archaeon]|jgi:SHS2 domain-containing protein|nr:archease [Candidatus Marsarchaeota archaeon]